VIELLRVPVSDDDLDALADLLVDAVDSGASVSFVAPLPRADARDWWRQECSKPHPRGFTLVARDEGRIVGCVQLHPAWAPNQPHRADVAKLLVHRRLRHRGIGRALMAEVERRAWEAGFTLLTLDTRRGDAAEQLYRRAGWTAAGIVPAYALDSDRRPCDTVFFYKAAPDSRQGAVWPTADELDDLVSRFRACSLVKPEWTHQAHLVVGTWHVVHLGEAEALDRLRSNIQRLNVSLGGVNSDTDGYHETITRAYVALIGQFVAGRRDGSDAAGHARALLASPLAARDVLLRFYSKEVLMSVAARRGWIEPDVRPISINR
jgi:GNAT superfamily N-acetyltransferase